MQILCMLIEANQSSVMEQGRQRTAGYSWWRPDLPILKEVMWRAYNDDISATATQLAFHITFSFFPMLLVLLFILTTIDAPHLFDQLMILFRSVLPPEAVTLIIQVLEDVSDSGWGFFFTSLSLALWWAVSGLHVLILAVNRAHGVTEYRSYAKRTLLAIGLTVLLTVLLVLATALTIGGHWFGVRLAHSLGMSHWFLLIWSLLRWPAIFAAVVGGLLVLFTVSPRLPISVWRALPGAVLGGSLWVMVTALFAWYIKSFATYNRIYGSIGGMIMLMLWMYLCALVILLGAELNGALYRRRYGSMEGNTSQQS
jgi:membrane protein